MSHWYNQSLLLSEKGFSSTAKCDSWPDEIQKTLQLYYEQQPQWTAKMVSNRQSFNLRDKQRPRQLKSPKMRHDRNLWNGSDNGKKGATCLIFAVVSIIRDCSSMKACTWAKQGTFTRHRREKKWKKFSNETWHGREPPGTGTHRSVGFVCHGRRWSGVKNPRSKLESNRGGERGCARSRKPRASEERRGLRRLLARSAGHRQSGCSGSNGMGWTLIRSSLGPEKAHIPCTSFFLFPKKTSLSKKKGKKLVDPPFHTVCTLHSAAE